MIFAIVGGWVPTACGDEIGSYRIDPESEEIVDGPRVYTHPDASAVLGLVITDWMTNPDAKKIAYGYLTNPDDRTGKEPMPTLKCLLIDERYVPKGFSLEIPGVRVELFDQSKRDLQKGEMCVRIDRFEPVADGSIKITFVHSGFGIIGGAWATYEAKQSNGEWAVQLEEAFDP
ncbi:MAG: hypothetical protein ACKOOI_06740 [Pirellula sp.]